MSVQMAAAMAPPTDDPNVDQSERREMMDAMSSCGTDAWDPTRAPTTLSSVMLYYRTHLREPRQKINWEATSLPVSCVIELEPETTSKP